MFKLTLVFLSELEGYIILQYSDNKFYLFFKTLPPFIFPQGGKV